MGVVAAVPEPFFLDAPAPWAGRRFCIHHRPAASKATSLLVYVHPWLEEMNKSRRMAALQCRELARAGHAVLQIDLLGCGDSSGDLADASWQAWIADVRIAADWLQARYDAPLWLWGLRSGCLLTTAAAAQMSRPVDLLFWHPLVQGKTQLQQFLRLRAAADLQTGGQGKSVLDGLRQMLAQGRSVEVAGYQLPAALASGLEGATLVPPTNADGGRVEWIELSTRDEPALLPTSAAPIAAWRAAGARLRTHLVQGPAFWQTTDIEDAPALLPATLAALRGEALQ